MLKSFKHKGLKELYETGRTAKINQQMHERIIRRVDALVSATKPEDMNLPGFDFHALQGFDPTRYSVHVNGPWCITFEFDEQGNVLRVNFEQYH